MTLRLSSWPAALVLGFLGCSNASADGVDEASPKNTTSAGDAGSTTLGPDAQGEAGSEAGPPVIPAVPRYSVPVDSAELAPWSYYAVTGAHGEIRRGTIKLEYAFPVFLAGKPDILIALEGPYAPGDTHVVVTAGAYGTGECDLVGENWSCSETLPGIQIDVAGARAAMSAANVSPADIERHLQVTESFSVDPIGIFEMRAADLDDRSDDD